MLMRAHREAFLLEDGRRGLTQANLLQRMSEVNCLYSERYSHVTVSRWESGATLPTTERLRDFGTALNLAPTEVEGLMNLAGFGEGAVPDQAQSSNGWTGVGVGATDDLEQRSREAPGGEPSSSVRSDRQDGDPGSDPLVPDMGSIIRYLAYKCVLTGVVIAAAGYALAASGWDDSWMPLVYVAGAMCLVVAQGLFYRERPHDLGEFYCTTVFFLLSTFLLQSSFIRMDPYGIYAIGDYAGTHIPYLLALEINLALASIAGLAFHLLRQWHYSGDQSRSNPLPRAVAVAVPPTMFAYATVVVISNVALWIQLVIVLPAVAGVFMVLLVLRDPAVRPDARDRRLALGATLALTAVMGAVGAAVVAAMYIEPNTPSVLPDHNLWMSWDIDFSRLGYPQEEALERLNLGYLWHGLATFFYMVAVIGGALISSLYGIGKGEAARVGSREARSASRIYNSASERVGRVAWALVPGRRAETMEADGSSKMDNRRSGAFTPGRLVPGQKRRKSGLAAGRSRPG